MEKLLLVVAISAMNILSFCVGARIRQKVDRGEMVKVLPPSPAQVVRQERARADDDRERERFETIWQNIEKYDGTGKNQKEVPR